MKLAVRAVARSGTALATGIGAMPVSRLSARAHAWLNRKTGGRGAWHANLLANPDARVQVGRYEFDVRARDAEGAERERLWRELTAANRWLERTERRAARRLPVVVLEPR